LNGVHRGVLYLGGERGSEELVSYPIVIHEALILVWEERGIAKVQCGLQSRVTSFEGQNEITRYTCGMTEEAF
jgi:hypothetical protein